ncbi:MAG: TspO/MBR family protein [Candidatus Hydrogenedens sp.]
MNEYYQQLIKPSWSPPAWVFGPVWTVLYMIIFLSYGITFWMVITKKVPVYILLPFVLNLIFNFLFTPIQFGLRNNFLASIDILCVLMTILATIIFIYPYSKWIAFLQIPYLLWVSFATVLQLTITYLNWK